MKKLIRLILKIPFTPFVVCFLGIGLIFVTAIIFVEWLYDAPNTEYVKEERDWIINLLKKWFTTI